MRSSTRVALLWLLQAVFFGRVMGQIAVAISEPAWLPPMQEWYSRTQGSRRAPGESTSPMT